MTPDDYTKFGGFFNKVIRDYHGDETGEAKVSRYFCQFLWAVCIFVVCVSVYVYVEATLILTTLHSTSQTGMPPPSVRPASLTSERSASSRSSPCASASAAT